MVVREEAEELISLKYRNIHSGRLIHAPWPEGLGEDQFSYGPVYRAAVLYRPQACHTPARKTVQFLKDISGSSCSMSHGMAAQPAKWFPALTKDRRRQIRTKPEHPAQNISAACDP